MAKKITEIRNMTNQQIRDWEREHTIRIVGWVSDLTDNSVTFTLDDWNKGHSYKFFKESKNGAGTSNN